jgi:hypothetical protein
LLTAIHLRVSGEKVGVVVVIHAEHDPLHISIYLLTSV